MIQAVLFDYGNTLVHYEIYAEDPEFLPRIMMNVADTLHDAGLLTVDIDTVLARANEANQEAQDHRVRPLMDRLVHIFDLESSTCTPDVEVRLCRSWLEPIWKIGRIYDDSIPVLRELRKRGITTAVVSNTPWGSPGDLWREELARHGIAQEVDHLFFCTDAGWRKPARQVFDYVLDRLRLAPEQCIFVGDDPRWDVAGPQSIGMKALLLDRKSELSEDGRIRNLYEVLEVIGSQ